MIPTAADSSPRLLAASPLPEAYVPAVMAAVRRVAAEPTVQQAMDRCAAECAGLAGYQRARLVLDLATGLEAGHHGTRHHGTGPGDSAREDCAGQRLDVHDATGCRRGTLSLDDPQQPIPSARHGAQLEQARALADMVVDLLAARCAARDRDLLVQQLHRAQQLEAMGMETRAVAHDLNNVLAAVCGLASLACMQTEGNELRELLDGIENAGHRGGELARRLLDLARRHQGPPDTSTRLVLGTHLEHYRTMLQHLLGPDRQLILDPGTEHLAAHSTELELLQIVLNLVVNARDAMPEGGCLRVGLEGQDQSGQPATCIVVTDDGHGMDAETLARATEPDFTTKADGSGLGLATVQRIVRKLGGRLRMQSMPGLGTTVRVELPRA